MLFCLLPAGCPPQTRLPFPELKARTATKTSGNFWIVKERCIETDDLQLLQEDQFISLYISKFGL